MATKAYSNKLLGNPMLGHCRPRAQGAGHFPGSTTRNRSEIPVFRNARVGYRRLCHPQAWRDVNKKPRHVSLKIEGSFQWNNRRKIGFERHYPVNNHA
jgi:hypothetical protein